MKEVIGKYRQGSLSGEQLQAALNSILSDILANEDAVRELGLPPTEVEGLSLRVEEEGGFDPGAIILAIVLAFATGAASEGGKLAFRKVMRVVSARYGEDAVGPRVD